MKTKFLSALCLCASVVGVLNAAPPTLAPLFPAGAQRGTTIEITSTSKLWANSKSLSLEPGKDKSKLKVAADAVPGTYWLRSFNDDGASSLRPFIVGTLPEVMEKEPNDEPKLPQAISESCVVNGKLAKAGDVDCFSIAAKKGQTLVASVEANRLLKSPMDSVIQIVSTDGFVLDENHDYHGLDPQVMYSVPKDGMYIVRVFAFPAAPDTTIRFSGAETYIYRLTITTGGFLDHTIPLGIDTQTKIVEARGWNIPDDAKSLPIQDGTGFHPKLANSFRPKLELKSTTHLLAKPGDEVLVPFTGKKGQVLAIEAASRSLGLPVDLVIRVLDKEKKPLARAEPPKLHSDTALSFTPPADGDYAVAVTDLYSAGSARHAFLLRIAPPQPDYDLTVAADRFTVSPGKPTEIPVKINRRNGYAWPVEIAVEGLPPGLKWELKPAAKPDPNAATIVLTAEKTGRSGPFQVIGRDQHNPAMRRVAQAPLPEFETSTVDLWFTVSDNPMSPAVPKKK